MSFNYRWCQRCEVYHNAEPCIAQNVIVNCFAIGIILVFLATAFWP